MLEEPVNLGDAMGAYRTAFDEGPAIFDLGISDDRLLELIIMALERGSPLIDNELACGAGVEEEPPDAIYKMSENPSFMPRMAM